MEATHSIPAAPRDSLDPRVRTVWCLTALLWGAALLAIALVIAYLLILWGFSPVLPVLVIVLLVAGIAVVALRVPGIQYQRWRYELGEEEIDLQHGVLTITRTVIPMARVQHVDTRRGPLDRQFGLAGLVLYTAAGSSTIPGLAEETAGRLRDRIATLANMRDDL